MDSRNTQMAELTAEEQRALLAQLLKKKAGESKLARLSFSQERLWFFEQLDPGSISHIILGITLSGRLDPTALERSLNEMVRRHETLRTNFAIVGGQPMQAIAPLKTLHLSMLDLERLPAAQQEAETKRLIEAETYHPFDLARDLLFRAILLKLGHNEHVLILNVHHLVSDGWSQGVLVRELVTLYQAYTSGQESPLPELRLQYADYARQQREKLQAGKLDEQIAYWKTQLGHAPAALELPTDRPRSPIQTSGGARESLAIARSLREKLKSLAQQENSTLFMILLAAFQVLLYRYTRQEDISVGTLMANRTTRDTEALIGMLINTLVLRTDLSGNPTFRELLRRVRTVTLEAFAHEEVPFEKLLEVLQPQRDLSRTPLFQVMLILQNMPRPTVDLPGLTVKLLPSEREIDTGVDLGLFLSETEDGLTGFMGFSADLFDAPTIRRLLDHFQILLASVMANPDQRIAELIIVSEAERRLLLGEWSGVKVEYPTGQCSHELFEAQAAQTPDAVALTLGSHSLTYHELNCRANQLARYLSAQGVKPETTVAICLERSLEMIISVLAVLKAGGAYIPLDPSQPPERLAARLQQDTRTTVLVTTSLTLKEPIQHGARVIYLDREVAALAQENRENLNTPVDPANLAYVIYTSGSTGNPKGVMVTHAGLVNAFRAWEDTYALRAIGGAHLQMANFSFDVFAGDWLRALCSGARLVLCPHEFLLSPEDLYDLMQRERITCGEFVPVVVRSLMQYLHDTQQSLDFMRLLVVGSDKWYMREREDLRRLCNSAARVISSYGLTEVTIDSSYFENLTVDLIDAEAVPIGRAFPNTQLYILDSHFQPVPIGVAGELYLGGAGLTRGYLNGPELTAGRFVPSPFDNEAGMRLYRTGDGARYLPDGNIQFLGRLDHQVKIRGFRLELGEIEAVLERHPAVHAAAARCLPSQDGSEEMRVVAYVVFEQERATLISDLQAFLKERLPDYMVPSAFVVLPALPLTPSGKIDRKALPAPEPVELLEEYVPPETVVEEKLVEIWSQILSVGKISTRANFFDLGGHSLLATQVIYRINKAFQMKLSVRDLFQEPTIAGLSLLIEERLIEELEAEQTE